MLEVRRYSSTIPAELSDEGHISGRPCVIDGLGANTSELLQPSPIHLMIYIKILRKKGGIRKHFDTEGGTEVEANNRVGYL